MTAKPKNAGFDLLDFSLFVNPMARKTELPMNYMRLS
jgi:hypothetical protein